MSDFRREIQWQPGYDHRNNPEKNQYGCHGLQVRWLLHGPKATMQFVFMTPWLPTWEAHKDQMPFDVLPSDIGRHADEPQYEGEESRKCDCRRSGKCYYDGSSLMADDAFKLLLTEGEESVWKYLEERYKDWIK